MKNINLILLIFLGFSTYLDARVRVKNSTTFPIKAEIQWCVWKWFAGADGKDQCYSEPTATIDIIMPGEEKESPGNDGIYQKRRYKITALKKNPDGTYAVDNPNPDISSDYPVVYDQLQTERGWRYLDFSTKYNPPAKGETEGSYDYVLYSRLDS